MAEIGTRLLSDTERNSWTPFDQYLSGAGGNPPVTPPAKLRSGPATKPPPTGPSSPAATARPALVVQPWSRGRPATNGSPTTHGPPEPSATTTPAPAGLRVAELTQP